MKPIMGIFILLSTFLMLLAFDLHRKNVLLEEEVAAHREASERLLLEIAENAASQAEAKEGVEQLRSDLASSSDRISELIVELQETSSLIDPDIEEMQASIRREVEEELIQAQTEMESERQQVSMVSELSKLAPDRLDTLVRVNSLYGDFFNSLNVSDERMEILVNAFIEMTELQNLALDEVRASNPRTKEEAEAMIIPILDSSLVNEVISVELTEEELELFTEFQETHFVEGLSVRREF